LFGQNDLGANPRLQGNLNLLGKLLRDTSVGGTPTFGWSGSSPEGSVEANRASVRMVTGVGGIYVKTLDEPTSPAGSGWRRLAVIGSGWDNLTGATPSVSNGATNGQTFKTANTGGATTVTNFTNGKDGQRITIVAGDANTTLQQGTNIKLKGGANRTLALDETIELVLDGSAWREV
jgi:hypothetical protein